MKNRKVKMILAFVFVFQLTIPLLLFASEKYIVAKGELRTFEVSSLDIDLKTQTVSLQIQTIKSNKKVHVAENFYDGLAKNKRLYAYAIDTKKDTGTCYLHVVDRANIVGKNMLIVNTCATDIIQMPNYYIKGDTLSTINRSADIDEPVHIQAEIYHLNGSSIIKNIYINGMDYMVYVNEKYYDLLINESDNTVMETIEVKN